MDNKLLSRSFRLASKFFSDLAEIYENAGHKVVVVPKPV
jgi:hypothetical protein